jgi:GT2 family glycosyltransferase
MDNASDPDKRSKYTTWIVDPPINVRMTRGFNAGLANIYELANFDAVWFFTSDCYFTTKSDPIAVASRLLNENPDIGILHPSEHPDVKVCFDVKNSGKGSGIKIVSEYDFVCPLFTKQALETIGWYFNPELYHGWGIDYESSYLVRKAGMKVGIAHELIVNHETSKTYDLGLDHQYGERHSFYNAAHTEMNAVLSNKYGPNWHSLFVNSYIDGVNTWRE